MWFVRFLVFWLLTSGFWLSAQQGAGPFRPGTGVPTGLPPTVPQKGPAYYPGRIAFIDSQGLLDGLTGTAGNCVLIDGSSQPCDSGGGGGGSGGYFTGAEIPGGTINGSNAVFTLANAPTPAASLLLMKNGLAQKATVDYTLSGSTITFLSGAIPTPPDTLQAWYNVAGSMGGVSLTGTPSVGYVPTATGSTTATWQAPAGGVWGSITGTLSNQTDLATALATKPTAALVTSVGSPGLDTNVPSEKAVATAIAAVGGGSGVQTFEYDFVTRDDVQGNWGNGGVTFDGVSIQGPADGNNPGAYQFPSNGTGYAVLHHFLPPSWSSGAGMSVTVLWAPADNGSGNEQWNAATFCAGSGFALYNNAPTYNAGQTVTVAVAGTTAYQLYASTFSTLTQTNCAVGELLEVKLWNSASGSGSTYGSALYVFGAILQVTQ